LSGGGISYNITAPEFSRGPAESTECNAMAVGPRFFETMRMPIVTGRDFGPQDERPIPATPPRQAGGRENLSSAPPLYAVINQNMARFFYGDLNPIGKRFSQGTGQQYEVIGVTQDAKYESLREKSSRTYYIYYFQQPQRIGVTFQLRTNTEPTDYAGTIQRMMREIDPQVQVVGLQTMEDVVDQTLMQERFVAQTASAFSVVALLLACIGLYGVMSHAVTQRTHEIGIRMALGARSQDVVGLVMREVALLVCVGAIIGMSAALATMRLVSNLLFGLTPTDPLTIVGATLLLLMVAALAGYFPARRASRVDPLIALRWE
jgi:predicted permease